MGQVEFYGSSDDLVEIDGDVYEEYLLTSTDTSRFLVSSGPDSCTITARYLGCWEFSVGLVDEDVKLPDWKFEVYQQHRYSMGLRVTTPEPVRVEELSG